MEVDMINSNTTASPYVPPDFFMARVVNPVLRFIGAPTLTVRGRRSGLPITTPLAPFDYEGARYLVGGGGETHWVRNLRAAGQGQLGCAGRTRTSALLSFRATSAIESWPPIATSWDAGLSSTSRSCPHWLTIPSSASSRFERPLVGARRGPTLSERNHRAEGRWR
jgi:hypothetical protein